MEITSINSKLLAKMFLAGAKNLDSKKDWINELNVFPVPDGDTGTNMSMTIASAADEVKDLPDDVALCDVAKKTAGALLRGARGNSGVILSLIFRGFSKAFKGLEEAGGKDVARAFRAGTDAAYKAVMKPTEGTILTVVRCAAEAAENMAEINDDPMEVCVAALEAAKTALASTPELLPVLKQAGVVDAGGQGFLLVLQGMESVFGYNAIIRPVGEEAIADDKDLKAEENAQESTLSYSVKFTVYKNSKAKESDPIKLRAYLEAIGENVTVSEDGGKIKAQLCTDAPGNVITNALKYGQLYDITLENLREPIEEHSQEKQASAVAEPINDYGFVSVCAGDGLTELFKDLGADSVVSGGQTMNPSTDDIVNAVLSVPAKVVYVLPNNKNIIMAAQMARDEIKDRKVAVLETKTIPQGISAMLAFDETVSVEENIETMTAQAGLTKTASVTFAARDSEVDGNPIKKGQMMGLCNGAIKFIGEDKEEIAFNSAAELFNPEENSLITVIYGKDETEENANKIEQMLIDKLGDDVEVSVVDGGQPVYYYIISVE